MSRILVADDDKVMLGLLKTLMELEGNEVVTASRPKDIVPAAREHSLALILMDYHLAGGNSMGALRELKSDALLKQVPVIVTSGMDHADECRQNGAADFILKPFHPAELLERIRTLIEPPAQELSPERPLIP